MNDMTCDISRHVKVFRNIHFQHCRALCTAFYEIFSRIREIDELFIDVVHKIDRNVDKIFINVTVILICFYPLGYPHYGYGHGFGHFGGYY